jgi:hypothetical protein
MYLRVRDESGHDTLRDFDNLPVLVQAELKRRFEEMWSLTKSGHMSTQSALLTRQSRWTDLGASDI